MGTVRYEEILRGLQEVFSLCRSLGIDIDTTRFGVYRQRLERLYEAIEGQSLSPNVLHLPDGLSERDYLFPLTEAAELAGLLPFLKATATDQYRQKMELMVRGPLLPSAEDSDSNQARNVLFELTLAAVLWSAGIKPNLGGPADVECEVGGRRLLFECKRPFSDAKLTRRINEAAQQLEKKLDLAPSGARGLIAISLSKVLNRGDARLLGRNEASLRDTLARLVRERGEQLRPAWEPYRGTRIIGVVFHAITPAVDQGRPRIAVGQLIVGFSLANPNTRDNRILEALVSALEASRY